MVCVLDSANLDKQVTNSAATQEAAAYETLKRPPKKAIREILHPELSLGSEKQELIKTGEEFSHV